MAKWRQTPETRRNSDVYGSDTARKFAHFVGSERKNLRKSLTNNIVGFTGQQSPATIHEFSKRAGNNYEVSYSRPDYQKHASAVFARFFSWETETFHPAIDLGVYSPEEEESTLLKAHYYLGRTGLLLVKDYGSEEIPQDGSQQTLAHLLRREPFKRSVDPNTDPTLEGLMVGPHELNALINTLHTNIEPKQDNKIYEIPGHIK